MQDKLGFTSDELALNRAGRLSSRQRQQLFFQSIGYLVRGAGMLVLTIILAFYLVPRINESWEKIAFGVVWLLMGVSTGLMIFAAVQVACPSVRSVTGSLERAGTLKDPRVRIGTHEMRISRRRWKHLAASYPGTYRAYYVRFAGNLLSVERQE
ncbi:MAG TPA: hypothetical protein VHP83_05525 [Aggregatilineaceae bacterium]|nr:hypothetical protein [Aggregatilineaceae bacterium]